MCVDLLGVQYLRRIHDLGRAAKDQADYLNVIQKAKYRKRRREAMRALFGLLTVLQKMPIPRKRKFVIFRFKLNFLIKIMVYFSDQLLNILKPFSQLILLSFSVEGFEEADECY